MSFTQREIQQLKNTYHYNPITGVFTRTVESQGMRKTLGEDCGHYNGGGYVRISAFATTFLAHRLAFVFMNQPLPDMVDHINRNKQDNRWVNLRATTNSLNMINTPPRNATGVKGLYKVGNRWRVQQTRNNTMKLHLSTPCLGKALNKQKEIYVSL